MQNNHYSLDYLEKYTEPASIGRYRFKINEILERDYGIIIDDSNYGI